LTDETHTVASPASLSAGDADDGSDAAARAVADATAAEPTPPPLAPRSRVLRLVYWTVWFVAVPIVLAALFVWALTPPSGRNLGSDLLAWLEGVVREQPVPVGIVVFTLFEMALWAARHQLPLASYAHAPIRADVPRELHGAFERARALLDEAELILEKNAKAVVRELSAKERSDLREHLTLLRASMNRQPFDAEAFGDALGRADVQVDERLSRWRKSELREYVEAIAMATLVAFGLRTFVIEAFKIPSGSMIPTLMVGDHIFVNKFSYGPAIPYTDKRLWTSMPPNRGDVMVFAFPEQPSQDFIKRVIALPGDKLEAKSGHPWINGWQVPSCLVGQFSYKDAEQPTSEHEGDLFVEYLGDESYLTFYDRIGGMLPDYQGPFTVKPGEVYVMGDNRNNSHDSRMWWHGEGGGVPYANIRGRALFVWLSIADSIDWSRFLVPVMGRPRVPNDMAALRPALAKCLAERPPLEKTTPPPPATAK
jgi:signal peptidase I